MDKKKVALAVVCDDSYVNYTWPMLYTFLYYNKWFDGDVLLICDNYDCKLSDSAIDKFKMIYDRVYRHIVNVDDYSQLIDKMKNNFVFDYYYKALYKFDCFDMRGYDNIVVFDGDMLIFDSLRELFNHDGMILTRSDFDADKTNNTVVKYDCGGISAGVFGIGKKYNGIKNKLIEFALNFNGDGDFGKFPEQDIMKEYFSLNLNDDILFYPKRYNCFNWFDGDFICFKSDFDASCGTKAAVCHFFGKPDQREDKYREGDKNVTDLLFGLRDVMINI